MTTEKPFELHCGDALEVMRGMADEFVDAIITDPPFGTRVKRDGYGRRQIHHGQQHITGDESLETMKSGLVSSRRILKRNAWLVLFCSPKKLPETLVACDSAGLSIIGEVVWDKLSPGLGAGIRYQHETILLGSFGKPSGRSELFSVVREFVGNANKSHPHEKPVGVLSRLILYASVPGDVVLDPFAGSGSTGVACMHTGRRFIGVEIDPGYFETARRRIEEAAAEPALFARAEQGELFGGGET